MMLTTDEIQQAESLLAQVREVAGSVGDASEYAKQRKLKTVGGEWERRVEGLNRCGALLVDVERLIEAAFS